MTRCPQIMACGAMFLAGALTLFAQGPGVTDPPEPESPRDPLSVAQNRAAVEALVGSWRASVGGQALTLSFTEDGRATVDGRAARFSVAGNQLTLAFDSESEDDAGHAPPTVTYTFELIGNELKLTGGSLSADVVFSRELALSHYVHHFTSLFNVTPQSLAHKAQRVLFIVVIVIAARLLIAAIRGLSHLLIFSERGPLRLVYRHHKNRARTIHLLVLNLIKYFIYFTALGMILTELGVNYATYLASLSVIGLAIGFGSQGLVQDMVTGFFIIFEGQFDVGDMIEVSGQTGVVEELGLRMTKLRSYTGQVVVIPNRNIAIVGNFSRGAQRAYVDVAVASPDRATPALELLGTLARELQRQYEGVILEPIRTTGPISLRTGEHFVRLHLSIWPGQTWVIDQQLLPRLRERFADEGIEIARDRVTVFYHARDREPVRGWAERWPWTTRKEKDEAPDSPPASVRSQAGGSADVQP